MTNKIDIYDQNNQPLGRTSTISNALFKGHWCRGAHVVVCTANGKVLVQKRAATMVMHPNLIDITAGGYVDAGETPEQAAVREIREELGITITARSLQFTRIHKDNHYWPKMRKKNRAFIYCYILLLPHELEVNVQQSEVAWARFIPLREAMELMNRRRIKSLGRIDPKLRLYKDSLAAVSRLYN